MTLTGRAIARGGRTAPLGPSLRVPHCLEVKDGDRLVRWELFLPWPKNPLPANGGHGNRYQGSRDVGYVRDLSRLLTSGVIPRQERVRIELVWEVVKAGKRDVDNLWKLEKALVDGLRDMRLPGGQKLTGILPDDDERYVERTVPSIHLEPASPARPDAHFRLLIFPLDSTPQDASPGAAEGL